MTRDDARLAEMRHLSRRAATIYAAMGEEPACDDWDADCVSDIDTALSDEPGSADVYFRAAFVGICVGAAYVALRVGGWL